MADYAIHDTTLIGTSNIIRKKEGSSALIDPADYPKRINLMGMLEEKTQASSSVCAFENGADDVPTKSVKITIPASLSGVSAVSVVNSGKNLANIGAVESCTNTSGAGSSITQNNDGSITIVTTTQQNVKCLQKFSDIFTNVKVGQTCILSATTTGTQKQIYLHGVSTVWTFGQSKTITEGMLNSDVSFYASGNNTTATVSNFQLEYGSTASAYEPYIAPTTYTASLGRTIYGGEVDIVDGVGESKYAKYIVTGQETGEFLAGTNNNGNRIGLNGFELAQKPLYTGGVSNIGENKACLNSGTWTIGSWCIYTNNRLYFVVPNEYTTFATALQYLVDNDATFVFPLATPTDFTFDGQEIPTRLGYNAFWSDEGDTEVTYRASGTITIIPPAPSTRNVNASIASFSDSDTSTPLLSVKSIVSPTSSGISSVVFKHVGKNHIKNAKIVQGSFTADGDTTSNTIRVRTDNFIPLSAGTYKIENKEGYEYVLYVYSSNDWQTFISAESLMSWQTYGSTFTLANDRYVRIGWRKSNNADILPSEIHDYILYDTSSLTQITANLGQTIYGGEVDAVNGTGTDEDGNDFTFTGQTINAYSGENNIYNASGNTEVEYVREVSS